MSTNLESEKESELAEAFCCFTKSKIQRCSWNTNGDHVYNLKNHKQTMKFLSHQRGNHTTPSGYNLTAQTWVVLHVSKGPFFSKPSIKILRIILVSWFLLCLKRPDSPSFKTESFLTKYSLTKLFPPNKVGFLISCLMPSRALGGRFYCRAKAESKRE